MKTVIGVSCIFWSILTGLIGITTQVWQAYLLMLCIGALQGLSGAMFYIIVSEFFDHQYKVRAYFAFQMSIQLGDTMRFLTPMLINLLGWR